MAIMPIRRNTLNPTIILFLFRSVYIIPCFFIFCFFANNNYRGFYADYFYWCIFVNQFIICTGFDGVDSHDDFSHRV